jgi:hypothetical protein
VLLAAAPAVLLAGCARKPAADTRGPAATQGGSQTQGDIEVLGGLLEVERATLLALAGAGGGVLARARAHDRAHVERLTREIERLGGSVADRASAVAASPQDAKLTALAAYLDALPKLYDERLRALAAGIYAVEAEHLAAITGRTPDAFVVGVRRA